MKNLKLTLLSILILSNVNIVAENLSAIAGNQSENANNSKTTSTKQQIEDSLSDYYQDDSRTYQDSQDTDTTDWTQIGLPENCGNWFKTVTDERRNCTIKEAQLNKDTTTSNVLLSQMDVSFTTRDTPYLQTRTLPPINVAIEVNPLGASAPLYRNAEQYEVLWSGSGIDSCQLKMVDGATTTIIDSGNADTDSNFSKRTVITALNTALTKKSIELKAACYTPAEPIENYPVNVAKSTIEIMPNLPVVNVNAPANALANRNVTVSWTTQYAALCNGSFESNISNLTRPNGSRTFQYNSAGTKTVSVTCYNGESEPVTATRNIVVTWPAATVNFNVNKNSAYVGENITGTWTSADAIRCDASFISGNDNGLSGSGTFNYSTSGSRTVSVTCYNGGNIGKTETRTVNILDPVPTVTLTAPATAYKGSNFNVSWSSGPNISYLNSTRTCNANFITGTSNGISGTRTLNYSSTGNRTLTVTCTNASGQSATATRTVSIIDLIPTVSLTGPSSAVAGTSFNLSWSSTNAATCNASFVSGTSNGTSGTRSVSSATKGNVTYSVTCTSSTGVSRTATKTVTITGLVPTVNISASPTTITLGQVTRITWSSTNATSCSTNFGGSGTSGAVNNTPTTTGTKTFTATCTSSTGDSASRSVNVVVNAPAVPLPTVTISANPSTISNGSSTSISWSSSNATSCTTNFGASGLSGTISRTPTSNTTYTATCTNVAGTRSASTSVTVFTPLPITMSGAGRSSCSAGNTCITLINGIPYTAGWNEYGALGLNGACMERAGYDFRQGLSWMGTSAVSKNFCNTGTTGQYTTFTKVFKENKNGIFKQVYTASANSYVLLTNGQLWGTGGWWLGGLGVEPKNSSGRTNGNCQRTWGLIDTLGCWFPMPLTGVTDIIDAGATVYAVSKGTIYRGTTSGFQSTGISGVQRVIRNTYPVILQRNGKIQFWGSSSTNLEGFTPEVVGSEYLYTQQANTLFIGGSLYSSGSGNYRINNGMLEVSDGSGRWSSTGQQASNGISVQNYIIVATPTGIYYASKGSTTFRKISGMPGGTYEMTASAGGKNGFFYHKETGENWICGNNTRGQLGIGTTSTIDCSYPIKLNLAKFNTWVDN